MVAVSGFLLLVLGFAMVFYSANREATPSLQAASVRVPSGNNSLIAGDSSAQGTKTAGTGDNQGSIPSPDAAQQGEAALSGNPSGQSPISVTIVNGENASANYTTLDVSGLTGDQGTTLLAVSPPENAETGRAPGTTNTASPTKPSATGSSPTAQPQTGTPPKTQDSKAPSTAASVATTVSKTASTPVAKPAAVKAPVTVTEYWIQTGSFSGKLNAEKARDTLKARYLNTEIFTREVAGKTAYRVRVGPYKNKTEADYWLGVVHAIDGFTESYVSEVKTKR